MENLYTRKLFSELEFLTIDEEFKTQLHDKYQLEFNDKILKFLDDNPEIKKEYDEIINPSKDENVQTEEPKNIGEYKEYEEDIEKEINEEEYAENLEKRTFTEDPDIKRIYRNIVKITHPDKLKNISEKDHNKLKQYYIDATEAYNCQQLYNIVRIATLLNVSIGDLSDENLDRLDDNLKNIKNKIKRIEDSITWKYFEELKNEYQREHLIEQYVNSFIEHHKKSFY